MNTYTEENYLKAVFRLSHNTAEKVTPTAIAEALNNNPASVIDMIKKLTEKKLIVYDKRTGVKLSASGKQEAIQIVRRHRLWEVFLLEKLAYAWDEIHDIAEELEHIKDNTLADRLDKFLGFPEHDPHGDPIPKANGEMPKMHSLTLTNVKEGTVYQVTAVKDTSSAFLQYLVKLDIRIGTIVRLIEKIPFDQSLIISINGEAHRTVSQKFGDNILVIKINCEFNC